MIQLNRVVQFSLLFLLTLSLAGLAQAATFVVPPDRELVQRADAIVIGTAVLSFGQFTKEGGIETVTKLSVEDVIKGAPSDTLNVVEPGGVVGNVASYIAGSPRFEDGQRLLLFLKKTGEDRWSVTDLVLGKFTFTTDASGQHPLLARDAEEIVGWDPDLKAHREHARAAEKFLQFIRAAVASRPASEDYFLEFAEPRPARTTRSFSAVVNATYTATSYTMFISGSQGARWSVFPNAVTFLSGATAEPGAPGGGSTAVQAGLSAWDNDPNSNVNYVYGGTDNGSHTQGLHAADGANTVLFERDLSSWGVTPFSCTSNSYSGTLGLGGVTSASGTHTLNGETFVTTKEGDVEMNRGLANCTLLFNNGDFNSAVAHELGHTLGFRHSDQTRDSNGSCSSDPSLECSNQAIMKSFVSQGLNATLQAWDQHAVDAVYPSTATPPPTCTGPTITSPPQSRTITQGQSVTLSVTATGPSLVYQWYVGTSPSTASPISGANASTLTVAPLSTTSYWVRVGNSCAIVNSATATITVNAPPAATRRVRGDFNGDGNPDILWRNTSSGANRIWLMSNTGTLLSTVSLQSEPDLNWQIAGAGDFNNDGMQDIVWRNYSTGQNVVWLMSNTSKSGAVNLQTVSDVRWRIESVNDFNADNQYDLLWRNYGTGEIAMWLMSGTTVSSTPSIKTVTDFNWHIAGTGDTNGDSAQDFVWRNTATGEVVIWFMAGPTSSTLQSSAPLPTVADQNWHLDAVSSYNGDRIADLVWRRYTDGQDVLWTLSAGQLAGSRNLQSEPTLSWHIAGPR